MKLSNVEFVKRATAIVLAVLRTRMPSARTVIEVRLLLIEPLVLKGSRSSARADTMFQHTFAANGLVDRGRVLCLTVRQIIDNGSKVERWVYAAECPALIPMTT